MLRALETCDRVLTQVLGEEDERMSLSTSVLKEIAATRKKVTEMALLLMLVGILLPAASYSVRLTHPTPSDLLVAISVALFSSVLFLWILDATSLLTFRAAWMSKAIYGAAIVSVLGTSVGVYKDYFQGSKYSKSDRHR